MNRIENDLQVFASLFFSEDVVNSQRGSAFESAHSKLENAKKIISDKMKNASPDAKRYLEKQHGLIELKQKKLNSRQNTLMRKREAAAKQVLNQQQAAQAQSTKYDENNPHHAEIIKQYHKVKMDKVRSFKNNQNQNNVVQESEEAELLKAKVSMIKNQARISKQNSEVAQKNSLQNNRLSKQKMVSNARNN